MNSMLYDSVYTLKFDTVLKYLIFFSIFSQVFIGVYNPLSSYVSYAFVLGVTFSIFLVNRVVFKRDFVLIVFYTLFFWVSLLSLFYGGYFDYTISETRKLFINTVFMVALLTLSSRFDLILIRSISRACALAGVISFLWFLSPVALQARPTKLIRPVPRGAM